MAMSQDDFMRAIAETSKNAAEATAREYVRTTLTQNEIAIATLNAQMHTLLMNGIAPALRAVERNMAVQEGTLKTLTGIIEGHIADHKKLTWLIIGTTLTSIAAIAVRFVAV